MGIISIQASADVTLQHMAEGVTEPALKRRLLEYASVAQTVQFTQTGDLLTWWQLICRRMDKPGRTHWEERRRRISMQLIRRLRDETDCRRGPLPSIVGKQATLLEVFSKWQEARGTPLARWLAGEIAQERLILLGLDQPQRGKR